MRDRCGFNYGSNEREICNTVPVEKPQWTTPCSGALKVCTCLQQLVGLGARKWNVGCGSKMQVGSHDKQRRDTTRANRLSLANEFPKGLWPGVLSSPAVPKGKWGKGRPDGGNSGARVFEGKSSVVREPIWGSWDV